MKPELARVPYRGGSVDVEYAWLYPERRSAPLLVFLHEGLGSLAMWRDYPAVLCQAGGFRGLVFSRPGYGGSTPRRAGERLTPNFHHEQAVELLPALFDALALDSVADPPWLLGHSDGASIAIIFGATFPACTAGLILIAPHIFVEDMALEAIEAARRAYLDTPFREKLAKYHADPDSAFWGWNDVWLDPDFRSWSIEALLPKLRCPVLAVQGLEDEYGTVAQIRGIARAVPASELLMLEACGHAVHKDRPERLTEAVVTFITHSAVRRGDLRHAL